MSFLTIKKELEQGHLRNIYIFEGSEKYIMHEYVRRINKNPIRSDNISNIIPRITSSMLFQDSQAYLLDNPKDLGDIDFATLLDIVGNNILIIIVDSVDGRKRFFKDAKKYIITFDHLNSDQVAQYIQANASIGNEVAMQIARYCGNDLMMVDNEIHKLKYLGTDINQQVVESVVGRVPEDCIFDFLDAVLKKDKRRAMLFYFDLEEMGESPIKLISMLYNKFKQVLIVQSMAGLSNSDISKQSRLTPFIVIKSKESAGYRSDIELLECLKIIHQMEIDFKTGQQEIKMGFEILLLTLLK